LASVHCSSAITADPKVKSVIRVALMNFILRPNYGVLAIKVPEGGLHVERMAALSRDISYYPS
jgi:hypothetical protein